QQDRPAAPGPPRLAPLLDRSHRGHGDGPGIRNDPGADVDVMAHVGRSPEGDVRVSEGDGLAEEEKPDRRAELDVRRLRAIDELVALDRVEAVEIRDWHRGPGG